MRDIVHTTIAFVLIVFTSVSYAQEVDDKVDITCDRFSIEEINKLESEKECFLLEGYVYYEYECICPPRVLCKPCHPSHIMISVDRETTSKTKYDAVKDISILTQKHRRFKIGKHYTFSLKRVGETFYQGTDKEVTTYKNQLISYSLNKNK